MKILAIEKEISGIDWDNENDTLEAEAYRVHELQQMGYLREIYFNESHNAVLILECESKEKALELLKSLPLIQKGLIRFEIMQLNPYTGFDRIIKE